MAVEAKMAWGTDFEQGPDGDLVLLVDSDQNDAPATQQRIAQLIQTNAIGTSTALDGTTFTLRPDDLLNPTYGASVRRLIGQNYSAALASKVRARILAALKTDPSIAVSPAPTVTVTNAGNNTIEIVVSAQPVTGRYFTTPTVKFSIVPSA